MNLMRRVAGTAASAAGTLAPPSIRHAQAQDANYRPDLDGLRGYAVVIAVLFHYGLGAPGGFIGPDIFFVISGYLIGGIVFRAVDARHFSFARFLEFRLRRVAPAALVVILACLIAGYLLLLPRRFERLAESALANLYFGVNHLFLSQAGYFDATSDFKPLLHTWSLSVEEQFYFVFPLLAVLITRFAKAHRLPWITVLMLASLTTNLWLTDQHYEAAYFLAIGRAWEFLFGALLVLLPAPQWSPRLRNAAAAAGLIVLAGCTLLYDRHMAYPGFAVMLPVGATVAIISAGVNAEPALSRWIGATPQRLMGRISYSFYLWHWPILVFMQHLIVAPLSQADRWSAFALTLLVAVLSWRFIEEPFRARAGMPRRRLLQWIGGGALVVLIAGLTITEGKGLRGRWQSDPALIAIEKAWIRADACSLGVEAPVASLDPDQCHRGDPAATATVLLWGDSHARNWSPAIEQSARDHAAAAVIATSAGCPPVLDFDPKDRPGCSAANRHVIDWIAAHPEIRTVVLASLWSRYEHEAGFDQRIHRTLDRLATLQREVVLVGPIPSYHKPVPEMLARLHRLNGPQDEVRLPADWTTIARDRAVFERWFGNSGLRVLDPWPLFCDDTGCRIRAHGQPLYRDHTHFPDAVSARLGRLFDPLFATANAAR